MYSMQRINRYGDNRSACRMPLEGWKESIMLPLNRIEILVEETQLIIRVIILLGK